MSNQGYFWTPEMDAKVLKMLRDKCTARQIGAALGLTKNAVIGRVSRSKELAAIGFHRKPGTAKAEKPKPRLVIHVSPSLFNEPMKVKAPPIIVTGGPATVGRPIYLLGGCQCRWAVNEAERGELHLFCGAAADGPYCAEHTQKSIGRGTEGERTADRVLAKAA